MFNCFELKAESHLEIKTLGTLLLMFGKLFLLYFGLKGITVEFFVSCDNTNYIGRFMYVMFGSFCVGRLFEAVVDLLNIEILVSYLLKFISDKLTVGIGDPIPPNDNILCNKDWVNSFEKSLVCYLHSSEICTQL